MSADLTCQPHRIGGKASALAAAEAAGLPVPAWFVVAPDESIAASAVADRLVSLGDGPFAVRSSATAEDGSEHSFAGQFETFLRVGPGEVTTRIAAVRASANRENVRRYREEHGVGGEVRTAVIVQQMVNARAAGVAFSAEPVSGRRRISVVSAIGGTGERLVAGEVDGETWRISREGTILDRPTAAPILTDAEALAVAAMARRCEEVFLRPQDIEWAIDVSGKLWLLQSRPITTLARLPDPDDAFHLWDNSNIAESYGGVTTPLTFTFARKAYEHVYREFCRLMRVPAGRLRRSDAVFRGMLGLIRGRVYYNLLSWYRVLALLPGFSLNRRFMEQMMGVKAALPDDIVTGIVAENRRGRLEDGLALARTLCGLIGSRFALGPSIRSFRARLDAALADPVTPYARQSGDELAASYRRLEDELLTRWDAPLVNDFFAMIAHGVLRKLATAWLDDGDGELANRLIRDCGEIISAEPPRRIRAMADLARNVPGLPQRLADPRVGVRDKERSLLEVPELAAAYRDYLAEFGDRCLEELKLESPTVGDAPDTLLASIGTLALREDPSPARAESPTDSLPEVRGWKGRLFRWVVGEARARVRERENLRFERTRLFGRVRLLLRELGKRLHADGCLCDVSDVFYLEVEEVLGVYDGTQSGGGLAALAMARRRAFEAFELGEAPPDRFSTWGPPHRHARFDSLLPTTAPGGPVMRGIGACPGRVRGPVRVVNDPRGACIGAGEILVARQTDPGWVVLFPCAAGLLVERGSLLSHSAIVSRELGLPCIVSLPGVTGWLRDGDRVEMDGASGVVRKISDEQ